MDSSGNNIALAEKVFGIHSNEDFETAAVEVFRFQHTHNKVYRSYTDTLGVKPEKVNRVEDIPFLPVSVFKTHRVICGDADKYDIIFESSTTTSGTPSKHIVKDVGIYQRSFRLGFTQFYGDIKEYCILALLPSYLERSGSSLVYMADDMIKQSGNLNSGFYMHNMDELAEKVSRLENAKQKALLIGVTYALLDFAEKHPLKLNHTIVMETGGMKGRRREMPREEVHSILKQAWGVNNIHSEYGMTELLSQAYSHGGGIFHCPKWMQVVIRDVYDPLSSGLVEQGGAINIIDLANINSCSFIATEDAGVKHKDGSFEVSGRLDQSDIRGCNLMAEEL